MKAIILPTISPGSKSVSEASRRASESSAEASTSMLVSTSNSSSDALASASSSASSPSAAFPFPWSCCFTRASGAILRALMKWHAIRCIVCSIHRPRISFALSFREWGFSSLQTYWAATSLTETLSPTSQPNWKSIITSIRHSVHNKQNVPYLRNWTFEWHSQAPVPSRCQCAGQHCFQMQEGDFLTSKKRGRLVASWYTGYLLMYMGAAALLSTHRKWVKYERQHSRKLNNETIERWLK